MEDMYKILITHDDVTPNQLYLLWSMKTKIATRGINDKSEERLLIRKGYIANSKPTDKGKQLLKEVMQLWKKQSKQKDIAIMGKEYEENTEKYNGLFPKLMLESGKHARSSILNVKPGVKWFFSETDYTWEEVFKATEAYVNNRKMVDYNYMTCSQYFARKQMKDKTSVSILADWCEAIRSGLQDPDVINPFPEHTF